LDHVWAGVPVNEVSSMGQFLTPAQVYKPYKKVTVMHYKNFSQEKKYFTSGTKITHMHFLKNVKKIVAGFFCLGAY
jgi:hypothetical protein